MPQWMKHLPMMQTNETSWLQNIMGTDARDGGNFRSTGVIVLEGWRVTAQNSGSSPGLKDVFLQSNPQGVVANPAMDYNT